MCLTCSCGLPNEDWGNPNNITIRDIIKSVATREAKGLTTSDAIRELQYTWKNLVNEEDKEIIAPDTNHHLATAGRYIRQLMQNGMNKKEAYNIVKGTKHMSNGKWIQSAIKKPGQLHRDLGIPQDKTIPASRIRTAASKPGKIGQRARFAETLKGMHGAIQKASK